MFNYKGIFNEKDNIKSNFYEGGAHFKYKDLYKRLFELQKIISPNRLDNGHLKIELKNKNYKNIDLNKKNYKENDSFKCLENKNDNIFALRNIFLKNEFKLNRIKNSSNNNIIQSFDFGEGKSKIIKKEDIKNEENNNNKESQMIKYKLQKLENLKLYKRNNKDINFKSSNCSLPKINTNYFHNYLKENKKVNKNNLSDIIKNPNNNIINKKYFSNNLSLSSNNVEKHNKILINLSNSEKNIYNIKSEENLPSLIRKNKEINYSNKLNEEKINNSNSPIYIKIKNIKSYNNYKNSKIKESINKIQKDNFNKELKNKKIINLYVNTFKKYYNMKNKNISNNDKNSDII